MDRAERAEAKRQRRAQRKDATPYAQNNVTAEGRALRDRISGEILHGPLSPVVDEDGTVLVDEDGEPVLEHSGDGRLAARERNAQKGAEALRAYEALHAGTPDVGQLPTGEPEGAEPPRPEARARPEAEEEEI